MKNPQARLRARAGHTLMELMVVVGIIGVTASTASFQFVRGRPRQELNRACWEIMAHLREARTTAVSQGVPAQVQINGSNRRITTWIDSNGNGVRNTDEERVLDFPDIPHLTVWTFPDAGVFSPMGTFAAGNYSCMYLFVGSTVVGRSQIIFVYPNGQVQLIDQ